MANYHRLTFAEREEISKEIWAGETFACIAKRINRPPSTITREVWNNVKRKVHSYQAIKAQQKSDGKRKRGRRRKIDNVEPLREYVREKLKEESEKQIVEKISKLKVVLSDKKLKINSFEKNNLGAGAYSSS